MFRSHGRLVALSVVGCILGCSGKESRQPSKDPMAPMQASQAKIPAQSTVHLVKGAPNKLFGLTLIYHGMAISYFDPPHEDRSTTTWKFEVIDDRGSRRQLSYSEGFPGGMVPKPRIKVGYRTYLALDWEQASDAEIDVILRRVEVGPKLGVAVPVALDEVNEFPSVSVVVSLDRERPTWAKEQIEAQLKGLEGEVLAAARRSYENATIKTYKVIIRGQDGAAREFLVDDNHLYSPFEVPNDRKPAKVVLQLNPLQGNQLEVTVGP